jgi:hypothetical protein
VADTHFTVLRQSLRQLYAHLVSHRVDQEVGGGFWPICDHLAVDAGLIQRPWHGPLRFRECAREPFGHCVARVFVCAAHDAERAFLWLFLELGDENLKASLRLVHPVPTVLRRVRLDP